MKVPLLDLRFQHDPLRGEFVQAFNRVIDDQSFILGRHVEEFEEKVASYCHTRFAIGASSGTDALLMSLMALGVGPGDEVITSAFSFFSTAGVVARLYAKPVFVDIDPITYNIDPAGIEPVVNTRTKAIIPVHLYGQCADMAQIISIAERHGIPIIEDAAQAIGAEYADGRRAGEMGQCGCLSFFPSKNLGGLGDGGMLVTNDASLAQRLRTLRVHGAKPKYYHSIIGGNFRLDALQAALLNVKFPYLDSWTQQRQANALLYEKLFSESGLIESRSIRLPQAHYRDCTAHYHIYNQCVVRAVRRDALREHLRQLGISTEIYYPVPFHLQECFRELGYSEGDFPNWRRCSRK